MSNNPFLDSQQQLFKMWNENMSKIPGMDAYKNMMPDMTEYWNKMAEGMKNVKNPMEYFNQFTNAVPNPMEYWKQFTDNMPNPMEYWTKMMKMMPNAEYWKGLAEMMPNADMFTKMWGYQIPGMEVYTKVFDFWKGLGDPVAFMKEYPEKYADLVWDVFSGIMPEGVRQYFTKPRELMQTCVNFYKNLFEPWMKIDENIMNRIASGDIHAYIDFFREFDERYEETFSKVFNMMGMGLNRESNEEQMHAINASIKMMFAVGELSALVMDACSNSMKTMLERYQEGLKEGKSITTFQEFYDLWYRVTEDALLALFDTDEFAKAFGDFADKCSKYLIAMNKINERMLATLPIPTNKDMKSLYQTVYDLRKEARDLRREVEALKAAAPASK